MPPPFASLDVSTGQLTPGKCGCREAYGDGSVCDLDVTLASDIDAIAYVPVVAREHLLDGSTPPNTRHAFVHRDHLEQVLTDLPLWAVKAVRPVAKG